MHAPMCKPGYALRPTKQIEQRCSFDRSAIERLNSKPLGGCHHCIGTGRKIVDALFRYVQTKCALHGGTLTDSELADAQLEFVDDFQFMVDLFEGVHARCMNASSATAATPFAKGRMLSSLLFTCSRSAAAYAFPGEVQDLRGNWLHAFYATLADFVRQYISLNAEARLTHAYVAASLKHGQGLTINQFLQEQTVLNVLRECLRGFQTPGFSDAMIACLNEKLDDNISADAGSDLAYLHKNGIEQMREFLNRFPGEIAAALEQFAPMDIAC